MQLKILKVQTHNSDFRDLYVRWPQAFWLKYGLLNAVHAEQRPDHAAAPFLFGSFFCAQGVKCVSFCWPALEKGCYNTAANTNSDHFRSALGCCQAAREGRRKVGSWEGVGKALL